jgi:hypothetical protein
MKRDAEMDEFGRALLSGGVSKTTIAAWSVDPRVALPPDGEIGSIFDALEDLDAEECLKKLLAIHQLSVKAK